MGEGEWRWTVFGGAEAAWAQVEARDPSRDREKDGERQKALKKLVFALAGSGHVDFDRLLDKVLASVPELARYPESVTRFELLLLYLFVSSTPSLGRHSCAEV